MTGILLLELVYTVLGGMVSIVITDFIQFVVLGIGTILVTIWSIHSVGIDTCTSRARRWGSRGFSPLANPDYGWAYMIFQILVWLAVDTCWQTTAMRTFSTQDPETSKRVFSWTGFIFLGRGMMPMMWGIAALAMLGPDQNSLEAMPRMMATILPSGVLGLVVAGMLAATMSVNSSYLLGWSSMHCAGHHPAAAPAAADLAAAGAAESREQPVRQPVRNGLGPVVHAAGSDVLLSEHDRVDLSVGHARRRRGRVVLEARVHMGGYCAMAGGAIATIAFFFFKTSASYAGLGAFVLAGRMSAWLWARSPAGEAEP